MNNDKHSHTPKTAKLGAYYDAFFPTFLQDIIYGNLRVTAIHHLLHNTIYRQVQSVLIVGCGPGQTAKKLAQKTCPKANILAIDLSANNIRVARTLFPHPRVTYKKANILEDDIEGTWQYIILPDVYEHIPLEHRDTMHLRLRDLLSRDGCLILTCPTEWHQQMLRDRGEGLQLVDEDVTFQDIQLLAQAVDGIISLFRLVSIWRANDYLHAVIERKTGIYQKDVTQYVPVKGNRRSSGISRLWSKFHQNHKYRKYLHLLRHLRILRKLRKAEINLVGSDDGA